MKLSRLRTDAQRRSATLVLLALLVAALGLSPQLLAQEQPPWIFGMHDPGGEGEMVAKGKRGWIVFTEAIGSNPGDQGGRDYTPWSNAGHGVIVRLNNGYEPNGTLPHPSLYNNFAIRAGNFVANSSGADIWIIGNETNLPREWPGGPIGTPITVQNYVDAFRLARNNIRSRPGHGNDMVIPQASGTYGPPTSSSPGGFLQYWVDILNSLGADEVDGLALHAYTHGSDPNLVFSNSKMGPPYQNINYHFRVYQNYMNAIPADMRRKPVFITETDQTREVSGYNWDNVPHTRTWMENIHQEISNWNSDATHQPIRAVVPFRWFSANEGDKNYCIPCVGHAVEGWKQAMNTDRRWRRGAPRVQYNREYWVIDGRAAQWQVENIATQAFNAGKKTVGFSFDDAGVGDLNNRHVVVWGWNQSRQSLINWYQQHYGGVTLEFRDLPGEGSGISGTYTTSAPGSDRGKPRFQYEREYWVVPQNASYSDYMKVVRHSLANGKRTVGFSYDDAGIGELNQRHVVVWGYSWQNPAGLAPWYGTEYTGTTVQFANSYP